MPSPEDGGVGPTASAHSVTAALPSPPASPGKGLPGKTDSNASLSLAELKEEQRRRWEQERLKKEQAAREAEQA